MIWSPRLGRKPATLRWVAGCVLGSTLAAGCGSPSAANIELRKQNQSLQDQVDTLTAHHKLDSEAMNATERGRPTTRVLSPEQLEALCTTHSITIGNLTGGDDNDADKAFDMQLKVYACPVDGDGTVLKAAGGFKVEAFDLDEPGKPLVGSWTFTAEQSRPLFYSRLSLYTYVLTCPFDRPPRHPNLTLKVTFDDLLTGRQFVAQTQIKVRVQ